MKVYLVGSLKDQYVREVANALRDADYEVFDDWHASGPDADAHWQRYEKSRGRAYVEALKAPFGRNSFEFDVSHLASSAAAVAVCKPNRLPGTSSIAELGYMRALGKPTFILLNGEPFEWELMVQLVGKFILSIPELLEELQK